MGIYIEIYGMNIPVPIFVAAVATISAMILIEGVKWSIRLDEKLEERFKRKK